MTSQIDQQPVWTAPATPAPEAKKPSRLKTVIVGAVAALVIGGGGFAVVRAASDSTASTTSQPAGPGGNAQGGPGGFGGGGMGDRMGGAGGLAGALYGDFTASDGNGGYTTKRLQSGTVTAVSATSITAKSDDGHTTTFVIGSSTTVDNGNDQVADIKAGDIVTVVGTVQGDTVTANTITDTALR